MCMLCPDFVDMCGECGWTGKDGKRHPQMFWLTSDSFCEHLTAEHGTDSPSHYYHFRWDHDGPDCECVINNWFPGLPEPTIPKEK